MKRLSECLGSTSTVTDLLVYASPEARCLYALPELEPYVNGSRLWLICSKGYSEDDTRHAHGVDRVTSGKYRENENSLAEWAQARQCSLSRRFVRLDVHPDPALLFGESCPFAGTLVVDISCIPRGHLLSLLNYLSRCQRSTALRILLVYSIVERHATREDDISSGIRDIVVVPGFNGSIRFRSDALALVLGFEGSRAFSIARGLNPAKTFLILGDTDNDDRQFFLSHARMNNHSLINVHGNETRYMPSRDPFRFADTLARLFSELVSDGQHNVYFSCLGTKSQAVGAFLALRHYRQVQVLDSIPSRRRIGTEGLRMVTAIDFGAGGLA